MLQFYISKLHDAVWIHFIKLHVNTSRNFINVSIYLCYNFKYIISHGKIYVNTNIYSNITNIILDSCVLLVA